MSIILLLSAAMGVTATGGAAPAPPAGIAIGRSLVQTGSWTRTGRGRAAGMGRPSRPGHGRPHRRHRGFGGPAFLSPYGGIDGPFEELDSHGNGFFAGGGGRIRLEGGRPYYDYDRAYPYEWASAAAGSLERRAKESPSDSALHCTAEKGVRVCRGGR